uniref:Uncharacterized protein n=1 Tax=Rhizobium loti TaxID=381 RepID=M5AM01_RHILI|nr:conserved hypothetical protein [Mesorhizobium loti NZP2037]
MWWRRKRVAETIPPRMPFHAALGFSEAGDAVIHGGKNAVRYYVKQITA